METVLPKRKSHHLQGYDYSQNGAYFITICTHQRRMLFGPNRAPVGADSISARMAARVFREIIGQYPAVHCRYFVVMPNHFHALVEIERTRADMESAPTKRCMPIQAHVLFRAADGYGSSGAPTPTDVGADPVSARGGLRCPDPQKLLPLFPRGGFFSCDWRRGVV